MQKIITFFIFCNLLVNIAFSQDTAKEVLTARATYYADKFVGRHTSSGEIFSQKKYTAAHKTLPLGTFVKVTNTDNQKFVIVKVNDRCPKQGVLDLTKIAAKRLDFIPQGRIKVEMEILESGDSILWKAQEEIFYFFDKTTTSSNKMKKNNNPKYYLEPLPQSDDFLWLRIATAESFSQINTIVLNVPLEYRILARAVSDGDGKYKILLGPYNNEEEIDKIKDSIKDIFPQTAVEKFKR